MCLFTHFAAGALAGGATGNIWFGAIAGIGSHAILDALPHYDHPDWRIELVGGILSLVILMFMPFVTAPAIAGGICGMLPDLENLFQKLGKMRRDQFIFPSHTGLVPHGKRLGPRSIVWQFVIFIVCFTILGLVTPNVAQATTSAQLATAEKNSPAMSKPIVTVLGSSLDYTKLRVDFPVDNHPQDWQTIDPELIVWALPQFSSSMEEQANLPPKMNLSLAVPTKQIISSNVLAASWWREPTTSIQLNELIELSQPNIYRSVPLTAVELPLGIEGGVLSSIELEIFHPRTSKYVEQMELAERHNKSGVEDNWSQSVPQGILNPDLFKTLATGGRQLALRKNNSADKVLTPDLFDLTRNWVKLDIDQANVYRLTGQNLQSFGVNTTNVDPTKLRLYRGGSLHLNADPEVTDTQQPERVGLNEVAIQVFDGNDGEWNLDDEIRFYAFGTSEWLDRFDPDAGRLEHYDHPYADHATYWLSWENITTNSPLPGTALRIAETATPQTAGTDVEACRLRAHYENQSFLITGLVQDNWVWDGYINSTHNENFYTKTVLADSLATFVVDFRPVPKRTNSGSNRYEASAWINNDTAASSSASLTLTQQGDSLRVRIIGETGQLVTGRNSMKLRNLISSNRTIALDAFDIFYWSPLEIAADGSQLHFAHWSDQVSAATAPTNLRLTNLGQQNAILWDVSLPHAAQILTGTSVGSATDITAYGMVRDFSSDRHFVAFTEDRLATVSDGIRVRPKSLTGFDTDIDYIVVCAAGFSSPGRDLADYRSTALPGVSSPAAEMITVQDIYDNFSGGQKDARAIRNFLGWVYQESSLRLNYACFLGDASRDSRNYLNRTPLSDIYDLVPTGLVTFFPKNPLYTYSHYPFGADDNLVSFESALPGYYDYPDLACGRLSASTYSEAAALVARVIEYDSSPEEGLWSNKALFVADDMWYLGSISSGEIAHTRECELVVNTYLPESLDTDKIYGVDYDFLPGSRIKERTRADIISTINSGTTIFQYVGHGSTDNLADEQLFRTIDIAGLNNGMKRPIFVAFSCDVGVFDNIGYRCMAEHFIHHPNGGTIGSIAASEVSWGGYNDILGNSFFNNLYPSRNVDPGISIGAALNQAKSGQSFETTRNGRRYNYLGDPATVLPHPVNNLQFTTATPDTLFAGALASVGIETSGNGSVIGEGDRYNLRVVDSTYLQSFQSGITRVIVDEDTFWVPVYSTFDKNGSTVFRGNGLISAGSEFSVPFKTPARMRNGEHGKVRVIVDTPSGSYSAVRLLPAEPYAGGVVDDVAGPGISMAFEDDKYRVAPGAMLNAVIADTSSVAIGGSRQNNSILLEFDNSGFMTDVTSAFAFDANSYTSGRLNVALPADLEQGKHTVAIFAGDNLGNVGSDTLSFSLVSVGISDITMATIFPNPTAGPCRLLFETGDPMEVQWDIYSLAGNCLYSVKKVLASAGAQIIEWNGRDREGDQIANGTYLYVLRGRMDNQDGREIIKTGKLVIMK